jgi:ABC-type multidrug transport system fused ATPase/permease subunit
MQTYRKLFFLLTPQERKRAALMLLMITIMSFIDVLGVASIVPFVAVLSNPSIIETNVILNTMFKTSNRFGLETNQEFLFLLGTLVFIILVTSNAFKVLTTYAEIKFIRMCEFTMSQRLVEGYLNQPFSWFLSHHSAGLGKTILSEVSQAVAGGLAPLMQLISKVILTIALIALLFAVNPKLTITIALTLGGTYLLIFKLVNNFLNKIGKERVVNNKLRFKTIIEVFGAIKEVKVGSLEKIFVNSFSKSSKIFTNNKVSAEIIAQLPRFILEAVAFGGIILVILYAMAQTQNFSDILPIISLYVFAGYRLMPALQEIYSSFVQLSFIDPTVEKVSSDFKNLKSHNKNNDENVLNFNKEINLNHIHYNYPNTSRTALKDINLTISAKTTVGLIGLTGCGKTTTVDIILGLLRPQKGTLEVDGKVITEQNLRAWQRLIGYVPQQIFLSDDTIEANIAFGVEPKNINQDMVKKVSKIANLHQFIIEELPKQYQTIVGERGVRLSGGQRQRIGIARALYYNPKVLILDEATSALDNKTEQIVMEAINKISKHLTVIIIAHRLDTVKNCNIVYKLDKGQLVGKETFN